MSPDLGVATINAHIKDRDKIIYSSNDFARTVKSESCKVWYW